MFSNLQIRPARSHRRKPSLGIRAGVSKRRVSTVTTATTSNIPSVSFMEKLFGEEFPEAFALDSANGRASRKSIVDLPAELLSLTCDFLSGKDIKRLRLASRHLARNVDLRIERVYISPNKANLDCLQGVLQHPRHSKHLQEIVWDDAQLREYPSLESFSEDVITDERTWNKEISCRLERCVEAQSIDNLPDDLLDRDDFFCLEERLSDAAKDVLSQLDDKVIQAFLAKSAALMSKEESYVLYLDLYKEEQDLKRREVDVAALQQALQNFPSLRRVTLTGKMWLPWSFSSRYDSPYKRSLPAGFRKPSIWPLVGDQQLEAEGRFELPFANPATLFTGRLPDSWRGYSIITSALLSHPGTNIEEFIIDAGGERGGISPYLFTVPNQELERTIQMFRKTPLRRLHLAVNNSMAMHTPRQNLPQIWDQMKRALDELSHLTHFDLQLHGDRIETFYWEKAFSPRLARQLTTLALRHMFVAAPSLTEFLLEMRNAQEITLDHITLDDVHQPMDPERFFRGLQALYAQHGADESRTRPLYTWIEAYRSPRWQWKFFSLAHRVVHEEINDFLYGGWDCPFRQGGELDSRVGWIIDLRDPSYKERAAEELAQDSRDMDGVVSDWYM